MMKQTPDYDPGHFHHLGCDSGDEPDIDSKIRHLPVFDKGKLVGMLTQRDLFRLLFSYKELLLAGLSLEEMRRFMLG